MYRRFPQVSLKLNCRTGSLESLFRNSQQPPQLNCRTGSLENPAYSQVYYLQLNCRTGSLEKLSVFIRSPLSS